MRSETGSSLVAVLATLLIIGALAAAFLHPSSSSGGATSTPAPQQAVGAARTAIQAIDAQQMRTTAAP